MKHCTKHGWVVWPCAGCDMRQQIERRREALATRDLERFKEQVVQEAIKLRKSHPEWSEKEFRETLQRLGIWDKYNDSQFKDIYREGTVLRLKDHGYRFWGIKTLNGWVWGAKSSATGSFESMIDYFKRVNSSDLSPQDLIATQMM